MKKYFLLLTVCLAIQISKAQIVNNGFENWASRTNYFDGWGIFGLDTLVTDEPIGWTTINSISASDTFGGRTVVSSNANANTGLSAILLSTQATDSFDLPSGFGRRELMLPGIAFNGMFNLDLGGITLTGGFLDATKVPGAGQPCTQRLASFKGSYSYTPVFNPSTGSMDSLYIAAVLRKGDSIIARAILQNNIPTGGYVPFNVPFIYNSCEQPDTLVIQLSSSTPQFGSLLVGTSPLIAGSVLLVDDLGYELLQSSGCPLDFGVKLGADVAACNGSKIILNPSVSGGAPPYSYTWGTNGNTLSCATCKNPALTLSQNSTYTVTVIDANNLSVSDTISYVVTAGSNNITLSATNTGIDCFRPIDTTVVTVTGGTPPYSFTFGFDSSFIGTTPQAYIFFQAGSYVISISDAAGCITALLDTVLNTRVSAIATSITQPACAGQSTGAIVLSAFNGVAPYTYTWSTGATGSSLSNVPPAVYLVTITDATSCSATAQFTVAPNSGWGYYFYLQGSPSNCSNNATITTQVTGSNPPFTYNWSNNAATQNLASLAAGIYSLTVTDAAGCTVAGSTTIPLECYSTIGGIVFNDLNSNCQPDSGETGMPNVCFVAFNNTDTYFGYTDAQGQYRILVNGGGTFTLSAGYNYGTCGEMLLCNNAGNTVTIAVPGDTLLQNNFAVSGNPAFDLGLRSTWSAGNPGFTKTYHIHYGNQSHNVFNGQATVSFAYDTGLVYQSSNPPANNHNLATHTLTWSVDSVSSLYGIWGDEIISADFLVPIGTPLGQHVTSTFSIDPTSGDCDVTNNSYTTSDLVTGSYDPNEKIVEPAGAITEADSILTYTIGFQNTGTDSTHFIILKDTLSENLDASSVRNIASSHTYTEFNISGKGILTWTFNPLRLVDSFTNEPESHGFVKFTIKKKPNLPLGTAISNKAYIYFDYNPAVITNLVENTLTDPTYIFEATDHAGLIVNAFPNPFTEMVNIVIDGPEGNFGFELFDVAGHAMRKPEAIKNNRFVLQRNALAAGVYFYKITAAGTMATGHGKLIVK